MVNIPNGYTLAQAVVLLLLWQHEALGQFQTKVTRKIADISGIKQGCETTGYEMRTRELCEEVTDRVCTVRISLTCICNTYYV